VVEYVRQHLPANILFRQPIPRSIAAADAFAAGQPVVTRTPADAASQAYVNVATTLVERISGA
jgi:chromosome partitioning protein